MRKLSRNSLFATVVIMGFVCLSSCDTVYGPTMWDSPQPPSQPQIRLSIPDSMLADNAGKLTTLYCLTVANYKQVPEYIRQNRAAFEDTQSLYQCSERFRRFAMQAMLNSPSPSGIRENVYNVAGSDPTLLAQAPEVVNNMTNSLADTVNLANLMARIRSCVPSILQGNDDTFYNVEEIRLLAFLYSLGYLDAKSRVFIYNCGYELTYPMVKYACP